MLKLKKPKLDKKVQWDETAVDNEFMGKKISKCKYEHIFCTKKIGVPINWPPQSFSIVNPQPDLLWLDGVYLQVLLFS